MLRSTQIFVLLLIPLLIIIWADIIRESSFEVILVVTFFLANALIRMSPHNLIFLLFALYLATLSGDKIRPRFNYYIIILPIFALVNYTFMFSDNIVFGLEYVFPPVPDRNSAFIYAGTFSFLFLIKRIRIILCVLGIVGLAIVFMDCNHYFRSLNPPAKEVQEKYELKKWAYDNTAPDDVFINVSTLVRWRSVAKRPFIKISPYLGMAVYGVSAKNIQQYNKMEMQRRQIFGDQYADSDVLTFTKNQIVAYAREIRGTYILADSGASVWDFPIVYDNGNYVILKIDDDISGR